MSTSPGGSQAPTASRRSLLTPYLITVWVLGWGAAATVWLLSPPWLGWDGHGLLLVVLAIGLILGELRPIPVSRAGETTDQITISTPFAVALVLLGPLSFALAVHVAAVLFDDIRAGRGARKILFNASQYVLTLLATRAMWCAFTGRPILGGYEPFPPSMVWAGIVAGLMFFAVNLVLISVVVALASDQPVLAILREDLGFQATTSTVLVSLGPVAAVCGEVSVVLLPLLAMPVLAVHHNARLAVQREQESLRDPLTGLANRLLFTERVERALAEGLRSGASSAVMLLDLDHFKEINDTLGHQVGDDMLIDLGRRLRATAPAGATVARMGGDEFAVLIPEVWSLDDAQGIGERLLAGLTEPLVVAGIRLPIQASLGLALAPEHGTDAFSLLRRADVAMYSAKRDGVGLRRYDESNDPHSPQRLELLADLPVAVECDQLFLVFQPQLDLLTGCVDRAEALVRWAHPTRGLVAPDEFIPVAENTGTIAPITEFVVREAIAEVRRWRDLGLSLGVSVNVSVRDLSDERLLNTVRTSLLRSRVAAGSLTLEVTESGVMIDPQRTVRALESLREIGVRIAIDDFGTGQASLGYLKQLAVDELKIDKSYVLDLLSGRHDSVIVRSTVDLAHDLGLAVVAEGVEDDPTLAELRRIGCDTAQGYGLGRPMPADQFQLWLRAYDAAAAEVSSRDLVESV
jgi:diguanylate cyclase (GGDEF)-like protein